MLLLLAHLFGASEATIFSQRVAPQRVPIGSSFNCRNGQSQVGLHKDLAVAGQILLADPGINHGKALETYDTPDVPDTGTSRKRAGRLR
jgi:hypothetical protein